MARMTVNGLVTELLEAGLLAEEAAAPDGTRSGRPARSLTLGPQAGGVAGAVVETDGVRVALADLSGTIHAEHHHRVDTADPAATIEALASLISRCRSETSGRLWSVVIGIPAPISGGVIQAGSALTAWTGTALAAELQTRLGHRVTVRNDADLCLLSEVRHGVAAGHQDVCYLRFGSGIGCGVLLGGTVHQGAGGMAGEIGHVQMDEAGALCRCGNRGCLETIAAPRELITSLEQTYGEPLTATRIVDLAHGDATASRVLADAGRMIGRVVAHLANTLNPSLFVLDGPLITPDGPLHTGVRESLQRYAQPEVAEHTSVQVSALSGRAALLGAVVAAARATPAARGGRALTAASAGRAVPTMPPARPAEPSPPLPERAARRRMITEMLRERGATARSDLVKLTRLPRAAVGELLDDLRRDGAVELCPPTEARSGRPSPHFRLVTPDRLLIGLAMHAGGVRALVADHAGRVQHADFRPVPLTHDTSELFRVAAELARSLEDSYGRPGADAAVAVSVPAPVHPVTGHFGARGVLPMFSGFSAAEKIAAVLGRPVRIDNNAQLAALAEARRGFDREVRDLLYLRADQYTGAGIVAGGRMHRGAIGYAGEVGHLNVREIGPLCVCGSRGCLSAFLTPASFRALLDHRPDNGPPDEDRLLTLAAGGNRLAQRALLDAGRLIGRTVAPLVDVLNPAMVVVGGRFIEGGPHVVDGIREAFQRHCSPSATAALTVAPSALGADAEPLGAIESLR